MPQPAHPDKPQVTVPAASSEAVQVAIGDLTGDGIPEAAVLILCHPVQGGPTNFVDEVQVFSAGPHLLARLAPPPLAHSDYGLAPIFVPFATFSISAGVLNTSVDAWSGTDAHANPSIQIVVHWRWNGTGFTPSPSSSTTPTQPQDRVTLDGYGRLNLGMTLAEATAAVGPIQLAYSSASCGDGQMPGAPNGVTVMFLHGRLVRIDIGNPGVLTLSGIGVGSSADDVTRTYPGSITIRPAPTAPNALWYIYTAKNPTYSGRELIFWIYQQNVTHYQVGFTDAAELAEGCLSAGP